MKINSKVLKSNEGYRSVTMPQFANADNSTVKCGYKPCCQGPSMALTRPNQCNIKNVFSREYLEYIKKQSITTVSSAAPCVIRSNILLSINDPLFGELGESTSNINSPAVRYARAIECDGICICDSICDSFGCDGISPCDGVCDGVCDKICDGICDGVFCDGVCDTVCDAICDSVCDGICDKICDGVCDKVV